MQRGENICKASLVEVRNTAGPMRKRFNRRLPSGHAVTVTGVDKKGEHVRYQVFLFKPKKTQERTIQIKVEERGDLKNPDPAFESVIRSIREPGRRAR